MGAGGPRGHTCDFSNRADRADRAALLRAVCPPLCCAPTPGRLMSYVTTEVLDTADQLKDVLGDDLASALVKQRGRAGRGRARGPLRACLVHARMRAFVRTVRPPGHAKYCGQVWGARRFPGKPRYRNWTEAGPSAGEPRRSTHAVAHLLHQAKHRGAVHMLKSNIANDSVVSSTWELMRQLKVGRMMITRVACMARVDTVCGLSGPRSVHCFSMPAPD